MKVEEIPVGDRPKALKSFISVRNWSEDRSRELERAAESDEAQAAKLLESARTARTLAQSYREHAEKQREKIKRLEAL